MAASTLDYIGFVEAAYDASATPSSWLRSLKDRLRVMFPDASGSGGYTYAFSTAGFELGSHSFELPREFTEQVTRRLPTMPPALARTLIQRMRSVDLFSEHAAQSRSAELRGMLHQARSVGVAEAIALHGSTGQDAGCVVSAVFERRPTVSPRTRGALARLASHLGAAHRLRSTEGHPQAEPAGASDSLPVAPTVPCLIVRSVVPLA